ncbi:MAG TPA: hypothetical protein ENK57_02000, partial [Polyangiaceae bacterium]|nr:hypothetical protein [Polyangiaceae bacterium]
AKGITVATRVSFTQGQPDYSAEVGMLAAATPDCIALVAFPESAGQIVRDWSGVGSPDVTWIGTDGIREPSFVEEVGSPNLIANFFGTSPITDAPTPAYNDFSERFAAAFSGESPIPFASNQYDATALLLLAIERAGSTEGPAVRDALREVSTLAGGERTWRAVELAGALDDLANGRDIDYFGAAGNMDFDALGNVVSPYEIWRYDPPSMTRTCAGARTELSGDLGSFCRSRTVSAGELGS